ncbi:very-long-chain aldehyde decarbonylase CER1-like isoform X2 [Mangifera indica]|uniref:very-long-chain aldehyde decarbonylase CER1-like isoform X2 n=1 Tax=Mangifera indica TaxID=29780 RepID=UPI001CFBD84D|nr:very-long-chain aldehyde decarbonylase CER1-like isoform X2 [Mangifera indica]
MASKPGILTDWPWKHLGSFKYMILAPWAVHSVYLFTKEKERNLGYLLIFPFLLLRMLHNQIWISLSRYRTAKGHNRIVDKGIEFDQVDRERNWDDQIVFNGLLFYIGFTFIPRSYSNVPLWRADGIILTILLHSGPVEFLYYWLHRALHHHFLYCRYHSHHHSSIVTEPITSVIHPFAEHIAYFTLFAIPLLTTLFTRTASIISFVGYVTYIDFMNNMGHCNFEFVPNSLFSIFPPLKYLMYTPSFHSLHHTQFRTNYSLFMPLYDYIYGTTDKNSDAVYETSLKRQQESADVVHLTHLTTPDSIYHLRLGFASLASKPHLSNSKWYSWFIWPLTCFSVFSTWTFVNTFISERNTFHKLKLHTWVLPRYIVQYWRRESINSLIEGAILEADMRGVKVVTLGLLNQSEELNGNGEMYIHRHPELKVKVVDGSSLAVATVVNAIPKGTTGLLFRGKLSKVAYATVCALCEMGIQVATVDKDEYEKLKLRLTTQCGNNLVLSSPTNYAQNKIWLVGDDLKEEEQLKASKGTLFIPISQLPPRKVRTDCFYHITPAMIVPSSLDNVHSCENWLPRRVMSAWRVAGIIHALEGWDLNECGQTICDVERVWQASLRHGFLPLTIVA